MFLKHLIFIYGLYNHYDLSLLFLFLLKHVSYCWAFVKYFTYLVKYDHIVLHSPLQAPYPQCGLPKFMAFCLFVCF